tara:strand:+ start:251 stop:796 length:546 start_codon:yes stop_codon:yes gene_type:complete
MNSKYDTAIEAYESIGIGSRFEKRKVSTDLRKLIKMIFKSLSFEERCSGVRKMREELKRRRSLYDLLIYWSRGEGGAIRITDKKPRVAQTNDGRLVVWYDCYDVFRKKISELINTCNDNGISIECFEKRYPSTAYDNATLLDNENFESAGNKLIYRGILLGFIVDIPKDFKPVRLHGLWDV